MTEANSTNHDPLLSFFEQDVQFLKSVGPARVRELKKRGISTIYDLLMRMPVRYHRFANPVPVRQAPLETPVLCRVVLETGYEEVWSSARGRKRRYFVAEAQDNSGRLVLNWFHDLKGLGERLTPGVEIFVYGPIRMMRRRPTMVHPRLWLTQSREYPETEAIYRGFGQGKSHWFRKLVSQQVDNFPATEEIWPENIRSEYELLPLGEAIRRMHKPDVEVFDPRIERDPAADERFRFDLLFPYLFALQRERIRSRQQPGYHYDPPDNGYAQTVVSLPYTPTSAQAKALSIMMEWRGQGHRINALLHGDVGSGKTLVAALLAAHTIENGLQVAFVAPTEILTVQQHAYLQKIFAGTPIMIARLTGSTPKRERESLYRLVRTGKVNILLGTHAIFDPKLSFGKLGLTIIDEQHRFGVAQREALRQKDPASDLLVMSATPIPRSLLMSMYGDLEPVALDAAPAGRLPIITRWLHQNQRQEAMSCIKQELDAGRQVYFVYPLVEEDETDKELKSVEESYTSIARYFGEDKTAMLHGQMKDKQKNQVFEKFRNGEIRVLVATTVIEVGVDVPNATVMVIQHADRFGLAQLHQLRGRVGRAGYQGYCFLISDVESDTTAAQRLQAMEQTLDGFELAEKDLELRGSGELLGERQSGTGMLGPEALGSGRLILEKTHRLARQLAEENPQLEGPDWERLRRVVSWIYHRQNAFEGG